MSEVIMINGLGVCDFTTIKEWIEKFSGREKKVCCSNNNVLLNFDFYISVVTIFSHQNEIMSILFLLHVYFFKKY